MAKRTLESFFSPPYKRSKKDLESLSNRVTPPPMTRNEALVVHTEQELQASSTSHPTYAIPIANLPNSISERLEELLLTTRGRPITNQPHLDLLYFEPLIPQPTAEQLFRFLRSSLPFYRVKYTINRFGKSMEINTPRYTTVFGLDETSRFAITSSPDLKHPEITQMSTRIVEASNLSKEVVSAKYKACAVPPRPIPPCLEILKTLTEALTDDTYNFVLVNYYSTGQDSISFHSDDERFLGDNPAIASFSLGARRDFLLKHKPPGTGPTIGNKGQSRADMSQGEKVYPGTTQVKLPLSSGDMILMRGETQRNWLHSIPKRSGKNSEADRGRINITMRKAMVPAGTANYYQYNVGDGPVYRWDDRRKEMRLWDEMKS